MNAEQKNGWRAIHEACLHSQDECLELLLQSGADVEAITTNINGEFSPAHVAARYGSLGCLRALKRFGAELNVVNEHGQTPLHLAAMRGHDVCMDFLLNCGKANVSVYIKSLLTFGVH